MNIELTPEQKQALTDALWDEGICPALGKHVPNTDYYDLQDVLQNTLTDREGGEGFIAHAVRELSAAHTARSATAMQVAPMLEARERLEELRNHCGGTSDGREVTDWAAHEIEALRGKVKELEAVRRLMGDRL